MIEKKITYLVLPNNLWMKPSLKFGFRTCAWIRRLNENLEMSLDVRIGSPVC